MARTRSTPAESTGDDESFTTSEHSAVEAVHVDDNNANVTVLDVGDDAERDDKVRCNCGKVEWDSQDAAMGAIAADMDGSRHTPDECRDLEEIRAERAK